MPSFFVPFVESRDQEQAYRELGELYGGLVAAEPRRRVYSITWKHGREMLTATVGETIRGVETVEKGPRRARRYFEVPRSYSDTVLAIFAGTAFIISHDNKGRNSWNVPIYADPINIVYFDS